MMLTCCPACATTFRITSEQLKAKNGKVRCGQCQHVFNALDTLLDGVAEEQAVSETPEAPSAPSASATATAATVIADDSIGEPLEAIPEQVPEQTQEASTSEVAAEPVAPVADYDYQEIGVTTGPVSEDPLSTPVFSPESPPVEVIPPLPNTPEETIDQQPQEIEPLLHEENESAQQEPRHGGWWSAMALLALALLFFQAAVQFRVELSVLWPETRPALQEISSLLGYDLPLPRKINLLGIESSELHPDPQNKGVLTLNATLKNRAPFAQTYPHLELTLTDTADQPILRKILTPVDYLSKTADSSAGFGPGSDIAINLVLIPEAAIHTVAAGYRLYLFYP